MLKKLRALIPIFPTYRQVLEAQRTAITRKIVESRLAQIQLSNEIITLGEQLDFLSSYLTKTPE